jgi:hypothetical protein
MSSFQKRTASGLEMLSFKARPIFYVNLVPPAVRL